MDKILVEKLKKLREALANEGGPINGVQVICSDETIKSMAEYLPKDTNELLAIKGVGKVFVDKYGGAFINCINNHILATSGKTDLDENTKILIDKIKNALDIEIYSSNLINLKGGDNANCVQLSGCLSDIKLIDKLIFGGGQICITKEGVTPNEYLKILSLFYEYDSLQIDKSKICIGYPIVACTHAIEKYRVVAPLVLFPINMQKMGDGIILKRDTSLKAYYNYGLLNSTLDVQNDTLYSVEVDTELSKEDFVKQVKTFYNGKGFELGEEAFGMQKIKTLAEIDLEQCEHEKVFDFAVIGNFTTQLLTLANEYARLQEVSHIDENVKRLVFNLFNSPQYEPETPKNNFIKKEFNEADIKYISNLDYDQERVIYLANTTGNLAVNSPQGGGNETILANLIANSAINGENCVVVSNSKIVLNGIYKELGECGKYAIKLFTLNEIGELKKQLNMAISGDNESKYKVGEIEAISQKIDKNIEKLQKFNDALYVEKGFGLSLSELIEEKKTNINVNLDELLPEYSSFIVQSLDGFSFKELKFAKRKFANLSLLKDCVLFEELALKFPWFNKLKVGLTPNEVSGLIAEASNLKQAFNENINKSDKNRIAIRKCRPLIKSIAKKYFVTENVVEEICASDDFLVDANTLLNEYLRVRPVYQLLGEKEKILIGVINYLSNNTTYELNQIIDVIYVTILNNYIDYYIEENKHNLFSSKELNIIIKQAIKLIEDKAVATKKFLKATLIDYAKREIIYSKRYPAFINILNNDYNITAMRFFEQFALELNRGIKIWLMTPEVASALAYSGALNIDRLIIDGGETLSTISVLPLINASKKVVVIGDFLKTNSLISSKKQNKFVDFKLLSKSSVFEAVANVFPVVTLSYCHTQNKELVELPNRLFYNSKLKACSDLSCLDLSPIQYLQVKPVGKLNELEDDFETIKVVALLRKLILNDRRKGTIGVVAFTKKQKYAILAEIEKLSQIDKTFKLAINREIKKCDKLNSGAFLVGDVEDFRGVTRDIIILSVGIRTINGCLKDDEWMLSGDGMRKINSAFSRASSKLMVVTAINLEDVTCMQNKSAEHSVLLRYLQYAYQMSNNNHNAVESILNSIGHLNKETQVDENLAQEIFKHLTPYWEDTKFKVVKDEIADFIIYDLSHKTTFAINCSGCTNGKSIREHYIKLPQFFNSRGIEYYMFLDNGWQM